MIDMILGNVRVPDQVLGDLYAQVNAQRMCARRLCEFLDDAGMTELSGLSQALQSRAEHVMRDAIAQVPDGDYRASLDADGFDADETHIEVTLSVRGSQLKVDYAGTSRQIDRGLNSVMNYTYAYTVYPIKCALDPLTPRNEGSYRSITVEAPSFFGDHEHRWRLDGDQLITTYEDSELPEDAEWFAMLDRQPWVRVP